ncbi:MAG: ATP-dependent helicase HrpB [Alcanivoracaceae bacterium]|nr:ATP-dependent helicase HrpB [Alcanivoracaceae bacterium]
MKNIFLPIDAVLPDLLIALSKHPAVVLQAPPGAGKTTRVPLALLDQEWLAGQKVLMLEPRRIAARSAALFMAKQLGEEVGQMVGYRTRLDTRVSASTRIEVVTEGILTRMIQRDAALSGYGVVIFDEFHERSLQADLGLALACEVQQALREDLRLLVMSATLDGSRIAGLLAGAPVLVSEGRSYPVITRYSSPERAPWLDHLQAELVAVMGQADSGSVLVFLPGAGEIRRLASMLEGRLPADVRLTALYGDLSAAQQDAAISPAPDGQRKVVLATAIAETSLTIEGIRTVVDAGFDRRPAFDPGTGMSRLQTVRVSAASASQRTGRAGRLGPGQCIRLWPESERLAPFARAEIVDADLADLVLELAQWGCRNPTDMVWLDPPPQAAWQQACELLQQLGALDEQGGITAHGSELLRLPLTPRLAHMVAVGRARGWGALAAKLAVILSERDILRGEGADMALRIQALDSGQGIDRGRLQFLRQALRRLHAGSDDRPYDDDAIGQLLALAFPDRLGKRRPGGPARFLLRNGRGAVLPDHDSLAGASYVVAASLDGAGREARIFLAASVSAASIDSLFSDQIVECDEAGWDDSSSAVRGWRRRCLGALVLEERSTALSDPTLISEGMLAGIRRLGLDCLPWTEQLQQWRARVATMAALEPQQWPTLTDEYLLATLRQWALPWLAGISRRDQLKQFPLQQALQGMLERKQNDSLDELLPTHISVPTGSRIAIDYGAEGGPVLAVKLQELFGLTDTPRLAGGRVVLTIHLLSPARRPVGVTADLASFWLQGYPQVRKELRGRYPKHPWPEDPLSAAPQRGVKR